VHPLKTVLAGADGPVRIEKARAPLAPSGRSARLQSRGSWERTTLSNLRRHQVFAVPGGIGTRTARDGHHHASGMALDGTRMIWIREEAVLGAGIPTRVGTRPPSTSRIVQSGMAAKDLLLWAVVAA
jgi:hypothetical protein